VISNRQIFAADRRFEMTTRARSVRTRTSSVMASARYFTVKAAVAVVLTGALVALPACGAGGSSDKKHVQEPVVRNFSPFMSPIDFNTLQQNPTFTDAGLLVSTDARFPGKIVIFCNEDTSIASSSVFLGGNPFLGPDPSALQVTREVPGVGNVQVPVQVSLVDAAGSGSLNAIVCQPLPPFSTNVGDISVPADGIDDYATNLPDGQYTIGLFDNIKNTAGAALRDGPVFHTFSVGGSDTILPRVVTTDPVNGQQNVGAGVPPPPPPYGGEDSIGSVITNIFGDTTPDIVIRFSEGINASTVNGNNINVVDAGAFVPGGGAPPPLPPAASFPQLRSELDGDTLPSNGHEAVFRVDATVAGGFPFGTQIQVTVNGLWTDAASMAANPATPDNAAPIADLAGNAMELNFTFQFQTIAPPDLPQNPFPENSIWWAASDRVGAIDTINQQGLADQFNGSTTPITGNVLPQYTDTIANSTNIPNFDPSEINYDGRTNAATCHSWVYVQSRNTGQVAILNTRTGIPVAILDSPSPGGIAVQVGNGSQGVLLVTNAGANTFTGFDIGNLTPGTQFLNGPLFVKKIQPTGNTPQAISISHWPGGVSGWNRDGGNGGPSDPVIMYADFSDGTVNTITMSKDAPVRQFALGPSSAPNDVAFTPCFGIPAIMFAAISQGGGSDGTGKVAYYVAGPACLTGSQSTTRPDAIVGDLSAFDGPDGLDENFLSGTQVFFTVAESGSEANRVSTLGTETGAGNLPRVINQFTNVGANPTKVAHRSSWNPPCIQPAGSGFCNHPNTPSCWYNGTEQDILTTTSNDPSMVPTKDLYVCARGASQVTVIDLTSGSRSPWPPVSIPGVRFVAGPGTQ
jgi:hypothetical protein